MVGTLDSILQARWLRIREIKSLTQSHWVLLKSHSLILLSLVWKILKDSLTLLIPRGHIPLAAPYQGKEEKQNWQGPVLLLCPQLTLTAFTVDSMLSCYKLTMELLLRPQCHREPGFSPVYATFPMWKLFFLTSASSSI
jgi:hypothetical protein